MRAAARIAATGCALVAAQALAAPARLPAACAAAFSQRFPDGWQAITAPPDAAAWARERRFNPVVARGGFDGNGAPDWSALVLVSGQQMLVFCLNPARRAALVVVPRPYCTDLLFRRPAGSRLFSFETYRYERIRTDGASVSCFEKAGATYVLEGGSARQIVDSD